VKKWHGILHLHIPTGTKVEMAISWNNVECWLMNRVDQSLKMMFSAELGSNYKAYLNFFFEKI
jgi:hypothetical protein